MNRLHLHLVSDSTGETLEMIAKAALAQFEDAEVVRHFWPMVRSKQHLDRIVPDLVDNPGLVLFTLVNAETRARLEEHCRQIGLPAVPALDAVTDDGIAWEDWEQADIVLAGVSRSSKTPTSIYLANRGYKVANIPIVVESPPPTALFRLRRPMVVGLTTAPERLVQIRRNRLLSLNEGTQTPYVDGDKVKDELQFARRMFADNGWPVIDVTRRSIEETAAAVIRLVQQRERRLESEGGIAKPSVDGTAKPI